jgi:hypothetical protein
VAAERGGLAHHLCGALRQESVGLCKQKSRRYMDVYRRLFLWVVSGVAAAMAQALLWEIQGDGRVMRGEGEAFYGSSRCALRPAAVDP